MSPKHIIFLIGGIIVAVILLQNTQVVSVQLLFWKISMSRIIFLPLILASGFMIGFFVGRRSWDW